MDEATLFSVVCSSRKAVMAYNLKFCTNMQKKLCSVRASEHSGCPERWNIFTGDSTRSSGHPPVRPIVEYLLHQGVGLTDL